MANFDDEDLPVSTKTTASTASITTDDLSVDWGDQDAMSTSDGLDRIQPGEGSKARVAVIDDTIVKPKMAWLHFIQKSDGKKVTVRCHSKRDKKHVILEQGECCTRLNHDDDQKAQLNFAVLGVKYLNADPKTGKYEKDSEGNLPPIRYELGWLKLSRSGFKSISELAMEGEKVHDFDFTIGHRENKIGYDYKRVSQKARWRSNPELLAEITEAAKKFADGVLLSKRLGKVITPLDLKALFAGKAAGKTGAQIDNTDDL